VLSSLAKLRLLDLSQCDNGSALREAKGLSEHTDNLRPQAGSGAALAVLSSLAKLRLLDLSPFA
jgi:hypothetical protein